MKIVLVSPYCDPAGVGANLNYAINQYTDHSCIGFTWKRTSLWNLDLTKNYHSLQDNEDVYDMMIEELRVADVIHYNHMVDFSTYYARTDRSAGNGRFRDCELMPLTITSPNGKHVIDFTEQAKQKRIIFHGHGGIWLLNPTVIIEKCKKNGIAMATCSPIDETVVPGIQWMPNILPISQEIYHPIERKFDGTLICSLAANDPLYKGGAIVAYVFEWLNKVCDDFAIEFETVKHELLAACLLKRKRHHFTVDNWTQGFHGMSGLEGLALGHVVFSRFDPMAKEKWDEEFEAPIPIIDVKGMDEFAKYLRLYNNDRALLKEKSRESREWIENNYTEKQIVNKWINLYDGGGKV